MTKAPTPTQVHVYVFSKTIIVTGNNNKLKVIFSLLYKLSLPPFLTCSSKCMYVNINTDIQIAIDYGMKLQIYFIYSF